MDQAELPLRASPFETEAAWKTAAVRSEVRLQWDPDHAPDGSKVARRAIQLGLRGEMLRRFVHEVTLEIEDISTLVIAERAHRRDPTRLRTPREGPYEVWSETARTALGLP